MAASASGAPLCFEAENAAEISAPMRAVKAGEDTREDGDPPSSSASGKAYIEIPQGSGNPPKVTDGSASYTVNVKKAGKYILWCRVWWDDTCANSITVCIDSGTPFVFGQDKTYACWHWVKSTRRLKQLALAAGRHVIEFQNREDGVKIDQILLTDDRRFVPVDAEPVTLDASGK
jgi:hypothetical protein